MWFFNIIEDKFKEECLDNCWDIIDSVLFCWVVTIYDIINFYIRIIQELFNISERKKEKVVERKIQYLFFLKSFWNKQLWIIYV